MNSRPTSSFPRSIGGNPYEDLDPCLRRGDINLGINHYQTPKLQEIFRHLSVCFALLTGIAGSQARAAEKPQLLVVISVDQMRADYLDRFLAELKGGLARLMKEGAVFTQARHTHVPTETCPGHAVILTGRTPDENGIVANDWWDRTLGKTVYCVEDSVFGRSPLHLLTPTLGDALKAADPASEIASFSEKDRAAIMLGGRKADVAIWYDAQTGSYVSSRYYGTLPNWIDAFNRNRLIDRYYTQTHRNVSQNNTAVPASYYEEIIRTPLSDKAVETLAIQSVDELHLGNRKHLDLLAIGFSATDRIGHAYGPYSPQMRENILSLDATLGDLFSNLDRKIGRNQYAVVLTADHGVVPTPESPEGKSQDVRRLQAKDFLLQVETALHRTFSSDAEDKWVLDFSPPHLYLNSALAAKTKAADPSGYDRSRFLSTAAEALKTLPEVAEAFTPDQLDGFQVSASTFAAAFTRGWFASRAGDLLIRFKEGILYTHDESITGHGTPYDYDARVPLIFWGTGIKAGRYDQPVPVTDLAPTAAKLIGVEFAPSKESRVLNEIFAK